MNGCTITASPSMRIRNALMSDAEAIERLFDEFVAYLRTVGDEHDYAFGARQYAEDGFGSDPAFRGLSSLKTNLE